MLPAILFVAFAFALGTSGGKRIARGAGAILGLIGTFLAALVFGAMSLPDTNGNTSPGALVTGTIKGLGILLRSPVPAPITSEVVTAAIVFTGYATVVACLLACTTAPITTLVPSFCLFLGASVLSQGSPLSPITSALGFTIAALGAMALIPTGGSKGDVSDGVEFAQPVKSASAGVTANALLITVLSAAIALAGGAIGLSSGIGDHESPYDPHQTDNYRPETKIQPITQVNNWQTVQRTDRVIFSILGTELPKAVVWAIDENYNGVEWQTLRGFDNTDGTIPYVGPAAKLTRTVDSSFNTTNDLDGPWLPTPYRPTKITETEIRASEHGVVIVQSENAKQLRYRATSRVLALKDMNVLYRANSASNDRNQITVALPPDFPLELRVFAADTMGKGGSGYTRLQRLADALSSSPYREEKTDDPGPSPFSQRAIANLVLSSRKGTQAQFATAFALLARAQGFETRVVAGFSVPSSVGGRVTSDRGIVWPEVNLKQVGWVPFAPAPKDAARQVPVPVKYKAPVIPKPIKSPTPTAKPTPTPTATPKPKPQEDQSLPLPLPVLVGLGILVVVLGWIALVAVTRRRLRSSLRRDPGLAAGAGAWVWMRSGQRHVHAVLPETPRSVLSDPTASESARLVAAVAESALYGPAGDGSSQDIKAAWAGADHEIAAAKSATGFKGRSRWWLVPMSRLRDALPVLPPSDEDRPADQSGPDDSDQPPGADNPSQGRSGLRRLARLPGGR